MTEVGRGELFVGTDIFGNGDWREDVSRYTPIRPLISSLWRSPYRSTPDIDPLRLPCDIVSIEARMTESGPTSSPRQPPPDKTLSEQRFSHSFNACPWAN